VFDLIAENYLMILVGLFIGFLALETVAPQNQLSTQTNVRWLVNFSLVGINMTITRLVEPFLGILLAVFFTQHSIGLFNQVDLPIAATIIFSIVILDLKQYFFHRASHSLALIWRVHQIHHSEKELDLTSGYRFHPFEAVLSQFFTAILIMAFGMPVEALLLVSLLVHFWNFFTHGNFRINSKLDQYLQWLIVTPSMHRVHHSLNHQYYDKNFGNIFSVWDRLFGSYVDSRTLNEEALNQFGLPSLQETKGPGVIQLLVMPFRR